MKITLEFDNEMEIYDFVNRAAKETRDINHDDSIYKFENVIFESPEDAQCVLDELNDCLERRKAVRVFDLFDISGVKCNARDRIYGWTDLKGVGVVSTRDKWIIDFKEPEILTYPYI